MKLVSVIFLSIVVFTFIFYQYGRSFWYPISLKVYGKKSVADVIETYKYKNRNELLPLFEQHGISYPPRKLVLIAFKDSKKLELWVSDDEINYSHITTYDIKAASGDAGPKLLEGDRQVPEGIYKIIGFNPNSSYHLSMKLNYPNPFDLLHAKAEGRNEPGTNIFIHGRALSIGCLAMGDDVIENLFSLVHATGKQNTEVIISPTNPSLTRLVVPLGGPHWIEDLYKNIEKQYSRVTKNIIIK